MGRQLPDGHLDLGLSLPVNNDHPLADVSGHLDTLAAARSSLKQDPCGRWLLRFETRQTWQASDRRNDKK
jgi:hypothetical protein